ncbi:MAG: MerR family transcriptional regulator [Rhodospirillales bacterium]|nr:MerR family transcriptional regulator [Alphaproteobacteria bacterium]MCB9980794.1 MerR family transcriptional regulator [Rhodospirillales bacterium]
MNQFYSQTGPIVERDEQAEDLAHEAAEKITGPLTGKEVERGPVKQPKARKSASAFRTISEVADILDVQQHVLRFWETKFSQIRPLKRGGGRRYYRPEDLELLKRIHHLLYTEGYTIKGVQKLLKEKGKASLLEDKHEAQNNNEPSVSASVKGQLAMGMSSKQRSALQNMVNELKELRKILKSE